MAPSAPTVEMHFERRDPVVRAIYDRLLVAARRLGPLAEDPKQTSIHLNRGSAFAGVATRRDHVVVTLKAARDIRSRRIAKHAQASAHRWYLEVRLHQPREVDAEFSRWLAGSWALSA